MPSWPLPTASCSPHCAGVPARGPSDTRWAADCAVASRDAVSVTGAAARARRPGGPGARVASGPGARARPDPGGADGDLPVRVPARHRWGDGGRRRPPPGHRDHAGGLRRRPPGQLRLLRLARGRAGDRPERLRRGASRVLGMGPAPAGGQRLGGRPGERCDRGAVRGGRAGLCRGVPGGGAVPGRGAVVDAQLQPTGRRSAARDSDREVVAGRDRAVGQTGPEPDQRPGAAPVHGARSTAGGGSSRSRR